MKSYLRSVYNWVENAPFKVCNLNVIEPNYNIEIYNFYIEFDVKKENLKEVLSFIEELIEFNIEEGIKVAVSSHSSCKETISITIE